MLRTWVLAGLILALAAATFDNVAVATAAYAARYLFAGLLLLLTIRERPGTPLNTLPGPARLLIRGTWLLAVLAWLSMAWSIAPRETALQAAVYTLLVAVTHAHASRRWLARSAVVADFRVIYWVLAATIIVSAGTGVLVGTRLAGLYDNPNSLGILAAFTVAIGIGLYLQGQPVRRAPVALGIGFAVLALTATQSRTASLGLALGLVVVLLRVRRVPPGLVLSVCIALAGGIIFYLAGGRVALPSVADRFAMGGGSIFGERQLIWDYAIRLWEREPVLGYGFRTGEVIFGRMESLSGGAAIGAAFNSYLQVLLEIGLVGMVPLVLMLVALLWALIGTRFKGMPIGLAIVVIAGLASGVTESALFGLGSPICWVFWFSATAMTLGKDAAVDASELDPVATGSLHRR